jgi:6-phosphofructokinase 1
MATFGILVGGGPAPGINGVIGAAAMTALEAGHRAIGILDGFEHLMAGLPGEELRRHTVELSAADVATIHQRGGSILHTSRANPTKKEETLARCVASLDALGIDHLVTIGGDDTAFSSKRVSDTALGAIAAVHVPKTIDNDLPLPSGMPTFGYETARHVATGVVENLMEDCRTTGRWFFVIMMGRKAGHLALGAGMSAGAAVTMIPEEFEAGAKIRLEQVARVLEGSIVKRLSQGQRDGVAVIAEGVSEFLDPDDLVMLKDAPRDEHGHIHLAEVPLGKVLAARVKETLAARGVKVAIGTKDVGYELRCASPCAFDREYTRDLGAGAVDLLLSGRGGALVTRQEGEIVPLPFDDLIDPETGRTRVRMVDTATDFYRHALSLQTRIHARDRDDPERLSPLAQAAGLSPQEAQSYFGPSS